MSDGASGPRARVLVIGWHGSGERQLRSIGRLWETLGAEPMTVVPDTWRGMSRPKGWAEVGEELADRLVEADRQRPLPLVLHAFSNGGFWTMVSLLSSLARRDAAVIARLTHVVIDSAPGFPERVSPAFTAKYASMAMAPALLAALGRRPRHRHWLLSPPLAAFLGVWHLIAPRQVRFMESSQALFLGLLGDRPLTVLYGDADELVPFQLVEDFLERARRRGPVTTQRFGGSPHVRHLAGHRHAYLDAMRSALA